MADQIDITQINPETAAAKAFAAVFMSFSVAMYQEYSDRPEKYENLLKSAGQSIKSLISPNSEFFVSGFLAIDDFFDFSGGFAGIFESLETTAGKSVRGKIFSFLKNLDLVRTDKISAYYDGAAHCSFLEWVLEKRFDLIWRPVILKQLTPHSADIEIPSSRGLVYDVAYGRKIVSFGIWNTALNSLPKDEYDDPRVSETDYYDPTGYENRLQQRINQGVPISIYNQRRFDVSTWLDQLKSRGLFDRRVLSELTDIYALQYYNNRYGIITEALNIVELFLLKKFDDSNQDCQITQDDREELRKISLEFEQKYELISGWSGAAFSETFSYLPGMIHPNVLFYLNNNKFVGFDTQSDIAELQNAIIWKFREALPDSEQPDNQPPDESVSDNSINESINFAKDIETSKSAAEGLHKAIILIGSILVLGSL